MTTGSERWCAILCADVPLMGEQLDAVTTEVDRSSYFAAPGRTLIAATRGSCRDSRWPRDVSLIAPLAPCGTGPLALLATHCASRASGGATIALLFPSQVRDTVRYMGHVRDAAQWVDRHPDDLVAVGRCSLDGGEWPSGLACRPDAPRAAELRARHIPWRPLALVTRDDTLLRLMEVHATSWWTAVSRYANTDDALLWGACSCLGPFDLMLRVLMRSTAHLRVRPMSDALPAREVAPSSTRRTLLRSAGEAALVARVRRHEVVA